MKGIKKIAISLFTDTLMSLPEQPTYTTKSMGRVLIVASSTNTLQLKNNRVVPTGYRLNELAVPAQHLLEAGYEVVVATSTGKKPSMDGRSNDVSGFENNQAALQQALTFVDTYPSLQNPKTLKTILSEGLDQFVGIYVPGGHAPMNDLMQDPDLGEALRYFHQTSKPTALLGHGAIAALAALPDAAAFRKALIDGDQQVVRKSSQGWQYSDYRMTTFSNEQEDRIESQIFDSELPFSVTDALRNAGARVEHGSGNQRFVIRDRELITGQNSAADCAIAEVFIEALDEARVIPHWVRKHFLGQAHSA